MQSILQIVHAACALIRSKRSPEVGVILPSLSVLVEDNEAGEKSCQSLHLRTTVQLPRGVVNHLLPSPADGINDKHVSVAKQRN